MRLTATPLIIMPIVLAVVAFSQWRAISVAKMSQTAQATRR